MEKKITQLQKEMKNHHQQIQQGVQSMLFSCEKALYWLQKEYPSKHRLVFAIQHETIIAYEHNYEKTTTSKNVSFLRLLRQLFLCLCQFFFLLQKSNNLRHEQQNVRLFIPKIENQKKSNRKIILIN